MEFTKIIKEWETDYTIQWRPLDMCNYDCSYCSPANHLAINKSKIPTAESLIAATKKIEKSIGNKTALVVITGGEPFLIPDIDLWLTYMSNNGFHVMLFTNASMPFKLYERCLDTFTPSNFYFKLSFHPETADIDRFVRLSEMLKSGGVDLEVRAMMVHGLFHRVEELETKLAAIDVPIIKLPVFPLFNKKLNRVNPVNSSSRNLKDYKQTIDNGNLGYYTEEELEVIKSLNGIYDNPDYVKCLVESKDGTQLEYSGAEIVRQNQNKFKGWSCEVSKRKLLVQANGDLQYGVCGNDGLIGNIFTDDIDLFTNNRTVCNMNECHVLEEVLISKFKNLSS
jgi:pyruvate-formate lyase-activating enzyme